MEPSLREKEKQIEQDMFNELVPKGGGLTVLELVEKYVGLKIGVRQSTYVGYKTVINLLKKDDFGKKRIDKVKLSDAKAWLINVAVYYGTFRYKCHDEYLYPCEISGCTGRLPKGNQCIVTKVMCGRMRVLSVNMRVPNFLPVVFQRQKSLWYRLEIYQRIY